MIKIKFKELQTPFKEFTYQIFNMNDDYLGIISYFDNGYLFIVEEWIRNKLINVEGITLKGTAPYIKGDLFQAKYIFINVVDHYINRFIKKDNN